MKNTFFLSFILVIFISSALLAQSPKPYSVLDNYIPSGYMGDQNIKLVKNLKDYSRPDSLCTKISFMPKKLDWGGISWQYPANNWCTMPGKNLSGKGFTKLTFWARGENGNEEVKFKMGQDCGDSYVSDEITQLLSAKWTKITINVAKKDLSNITGAFLWVIDSKANPQSSGSITFYLDDVQFE